MAADLPPVDDSRPSPGSAGPCPPCAATEAGQPVECLGEDKCWCAVQHDHGPWNG